jgi:hypothetical protein
MLPRILARVADKFADIITDKCPFVPIAAIHIFGIERLLANERLTTDDAPNRPIASAGNVAPNHPEGIPARRNHAYA